MKAFSVGALSVFTLVFSLFLAITLIYPTLPPGNIFEGLWKNIVNGLFYGVILWLIYAVAVSLSGSKPKLEPKPKPKPKPKPTVEKPLKIEVSKPEVEKKIKVEPEKASIPVIKIEGIGRVYSKKLNSIGIYTTDDLLEAGGTKVGRQELSEKAGISSKLILKWVNLSDLHRLKGVAEEYSDLLEEAGVDTVVELARRNPDNLYAKLLEINEEKKLVRRPPTLTDVKSWVDQAKKLPRKIEY